MAVCFDMYAQGLPDPQEAPVLARCDYCEGEIYKSQEVWVWEGGVYCSDSCLHGQVEQEAIQVNIEEVAI